MIISVHTRKPNGFPHAAGGAYDERSTLLESTTPMNPARLLAFAVALLALAACDDPTTPPPPQVGQAAHAANTDHADAETGPPVEASGTPTVEPFNARNLTGWTFRGRKQWHKWRPGLVSFDPEKPKTLIVAEPTADADAQDIALVTDAFVGTDLYTEQKFRDFRLELQFMLPAGGNSGVFLLGEYELQIIDDDEPTTPADMKLGAIARTLAPQSLLAIEPGQWHDLLVEFRAPRFDDAGQKTASAKLVEVRINGELMHENAEIPAPTPGRLSDDDAPEPSEGPLLLQGREGPAAYRRIRITPR